MIINLLCTLGGVIIGALLCYIALQRIIMECAIAVAAYLQGDDDATE